MATSTLYLGDPGRDSALPAPHLVRLGGPGKGQVGAGKGRQVRVAVYIPNPHSQRFLPGLLGIRGSGAPGAQPGLSLPCKEQR